MEIHKAELKENSVSPKGKMKVLAKLPEAAVCGKGTFLVCLEPEADLSKAATNVAPALWVS